MDWAHSIQSTAPRQTLISTHQQSLNNEGIRTEMEYLCITFREELKKLTDQKTGGNG